MTTYEIISTIIAGASLIVAVVAIIVSYMTKKKCDKFIESQMKIEKNSGVAVGVNEGNMNVLQK